MEKQKNIPQLRFPEFEGEWEKKKLGEISVINPTTNKIPDRFIYIDLESVTNGELTKEEIIIKHKAPSRAQRVLQKDDILFQMVRPYQKNNLYFDKDGDYVASTGYAQIKTKQNSRYLYQYLHLQKFVDEVIERCTGTSYPAINSKDLAKIYIRFPSLLEQQQIASFFTAIDQKIFQLKRKKTLLERYKKGVMQKIFSQQIRFKGDNGQEFPNWEKKRLGDISERMTNKNTEGNENVLTISAQHGLVGQLDFFNKSVAATDLSGYYLLKKDDFAYNKSYSAGYPMGAFKRLKLYDKGVVSTLYICFTFKTDVSISYMEQYFESGKHNREIEKVAQEGARNHGLLNIGVGDFFNTEILLPSLPEQTKIANFLSAIDNKINHTQKQIYKAEVWKKGLMQQMFV
jgi:type I restriction enzyme S subunit